MSGSRAKRIWIPALVGVILGARVVWAFATEHTMRMVYLVASGALALLLCWLWWCLLAGAFRWRSLLRGVIVMLVLGVAAKLTLRWDGSADGATPFRLVWKWTPSREAGLEELSSLTAPAPAAEEPERPADLADAPRFLGAAGDGAFPDPSLATDWKANPPQELWRIRVGVGFSSFAVSGRYAVTQEQRNQAELVTCYDVQTGALLWAHQDSVRHEDRFGGPGPRATPAIADGAVYALGATGILNALDLKTGARRWSKFVQVEQGLADLEYGAAASPLVCDGLVVVTCGMATGSDAAGKAVVFAYGCQDGALRWKYGPGPASYSSPCLLEINGERQVVAVLGGAVAGLDPLQGTQKWRFEWPGGTPKVAQPVQVAPDQILVTSAYGVSSHLLKIKGSTAEPVWSKVQMKTKFSSPVVRGNHAYGLDEGKLICMDLKDGSRVWKGERYGYGQNLLVGDLLLIQAESGEVVLTRPRPEGHEELSRIAPLQGKTWNAPVLAGRYLLVRNDVEAVCLKLP